jgi:hypothetical protein
MAFTITNGTKSYVERAVGVYTPSTATFGSPVVDSIKLTPGRKNRDGSYSLGITGSTQKLVEISGVSAVQTARIALAVQMTGPYFSETELIAVLADLSAHFIATGHLNRQLQGEV